jgi:hypothetical protein
LDIDIIPDQFHAYLAEKTRQWGFASGRPHLQVCLPTLFGAGTSWKDRSASFKLGQIELWMAHPMDVVIGKLFRFNEKDLRDIDALAASIQRPTADDYSFYLRQNTDVLAPGTKHEALLGNIETLFAYRGWPDPQWLRPLASSVRALASDEEQRIALLDQEIARIASPESHDPGPTDL